MLVLIASAEFQHFKDASDQQGQLVLLLLDICLNVLFEISLLLEARLELDEVALRLCLLFFDEYRNFFVQILHVFVQFLDLRLAKLLDSLDFPTDSRLELFLVEAEHSVGFVELFDLIGLLGNYLLEFSDLLHCLRVLALAG